MLREKLFIWFQQWVNIYQRSPSPEKSFVPFISQLTKQGILKAEDVSSFFFRVCMESSVNSYVKCINSGEFDYAFQALDAFSRLIVYMIKYHGDASGVNNEQAKVHYLTKILSIVVLVLAKMHEEQDLLFPQKPNDLANISAGDCQPVAAGRLVGLGLTAKQADQTKTTPNDDREEKAAKSHTPALGSTMANPAIDRRWTRVRCRPEFAS